MTHFQIERRGGGHSVKKKFLTYLKIFLSKPLIYNKDEIIPTVPKNPQILNIFIKNYSNFWLDCKNNLKKKPGHEFRKSVFAEKMLGYT